MKTAQNNASGSAPDLATVMPLITGIATALAAWKLFEPKFARIRALYEENGRLEPGFIVLYVIPQRILASVSAVIAAILIIAFVNSVWPIAIAHYIPIAFIIEITTPSNIILTIFLISIIAAIIYWNIVTRLLLLFSQLVALLPLPLLRNRFGPRGYSVGWHQTKCVCEGPDKGAPLLISRAAIERISWEVLGKLGNPGVKLPHFAAEPAGLSASEKANLALFGCVMEENFYANRWAPPDWAVFYEGLSEIHKQRPIFRPDELMSFGSGEAFFDFFRQRLDSVLTIKEQTPPPNRSLAAAGDIASIWNLLAERTDGDLLRLIPRWSWLLGGKLFWLDQRLRSFPRLKSEGMRPQLIKLLIRWNTLPNTRGGVFVQPFAKRQVWLLFQKGVLRALPEMKEVTFNGTGQVAIARFAARKVVERVSDLILARETPEAQAALAQVGDSRWDTEAAADFALWSWAATKYRTAQDANWDKNKWHWKFDVDGRVIRLA